MSGAAAANPEQTQGDSGYESAATTPVQTAPQAVQPPTSTLDENPALKGPTPVNGNTGSADKNAPETQTPGSTGTVAPQAAPPPPPVVLTPLKPSGLKGLMQSMADTLAGTTRPELAKGSDGQMYVKDVTLTHGQQWRKIIGEGLTGAAAGLAAGKGAGNMVKAPLAGVESAQADQKRQQDQRAQLSDEAQKLNLQYANHQMLQMNLAEKGWDLADKKVQATRQAVEAAEKEDDRLVSHGYQVLGVAPHAADLSEVLHADPNLMENMIKNHVIEVRPAYDENGNVNGVRAFKAPQDPQTKILAPGWAFDKFNPDTGKIEQHNASDPGTVLQQNVYSSQAQSEYLDYIKKIHDDAKTQAETTAANDKHSQVPLENKKLEAETSRDNAQAGRANAEAANSRALAHGAEASQQPLSVWSPQQQQAVTGLASYSVNPATFPTRTQAKAGQMDRETAIGYARQIDPSYDEKEYGTRSKLQSDFRSGKSAQNIRSLNTAIDHLDAMASSGTALHNTNYQAPNWVKNTVAPWFGATAPGQFHKDVNAVAGELSQLFKGTGATDKEIESWKKDMSAAQTPAQIRTGINEALKLMGGRYDALENQYTTGMGRPRDFQMLSPHSQKILSNLGATDLVQKDVNVPQQQSAQPAAPTAHNFSPSAWKAANPNGDVNAAIAAAKKQGYTVIQ